MDFLSESRPTEISVFNPLTRSFEPVRVNSIISPETQYAAGIVAWQQDFGAIYNPSVSASRTSEIVRSSRESAVLVGSTSYIVVENSAQRKMLERKQNQKLRNSSVLEFEEKEASVPEPSTWRLIVFGGGMVFDLGVPPETNARR